MNPGLQHQGAITSKDSDFSLLHSVQTCSGNEEVLPGGKAGGVMKLATQFHLGLRL